MTGLWGSLIPLIIGSALVPIQIVITVLLLRSGTGKAATAAWVAGMTVARLGQGVVFGLVLGSTVASADGTDGPGAIASTLLLVVAIVFYVSAVKQLLGHPDEDAPPPKWMAMLEGATPRKAFLMGIGLILLGAKFWVFTLGAIAAIGEADLGQGAAVVVFLVFVVLAGSVHLALLAVAYLMPERSEVLLGRMSRFLETYNRPIMITLGLVFGTWFLISALDGLGVL